MAEKLAKKVEDELNCSICLDTYTDPKLLQCFHVYCRKCLVKLVVRDQQGQLSLTCPICRQDTPVPANGVAGLQPAFQISHLLEILDEHKKTTTEPPEKAAAGREPISLDKTKICCQEHLGKEVALYCETCGEPVCVKCALKGGKHHGHDYEELNEAFEKYKVEITASLEPMEEQLTTVNKALAQLDTRCGEIANQQAGIEDDIHETFRRLHEIFNTRKTELIGQLHRLTQKKLKSLAVQRDQLETTQAQLRSCLGSMKESLTTGSQEEVLVMKTSVTKRVKQLTTTFPPDLLKPSTEADMTFSSSADLTTVCQNYGEIVARGMPDPSQCHVTGLGTGAAVAGETSTVVLHAYNHKGQTCVESIKSAEIEVVSEILGVGTPGSIERREENQYEISYCALVKGRHQLHVKVEGEHVRESPFDIVAKSPVEKLSTPILTMGEVNRPWGVAINQRGEVVVAETGASCVSVFNASGRRVHFFGTRGSENGQFMSPCGVAVDGEGNILLTDSDKHCIHKFTSQGQILSAVGSEGSRALQFHSPADITFGARNHMVYVADTGNHRIQKLNPDLTFCSTFGKHGRGRGELSYPCGVARDSTGKVYVADSSNHHVQVFTAEGKLKRVFGRSGQGRGELKCPHSIAIDNNSMIYVSECKNNRVSVFNPDGGFLMWFGCCDDLAREFRGITVDSSGVVYVCDYFNHRVQAF